MLRNRHLYCHFFLLQIIVVMFDYESGSSEGEGDIRESLCKKAERVRQWYSREIQTTCVSPNNANEPRGLYASMARWHINSHVEDETWIEKYKSISWKLGIEKKMLVDQKLKEFIIKKKKKNALVDRYKPPEILDILIPYIRNSYEKAIEAEEEEFSDKIEKLSGEEQQFFLDIYEPSAFLYTYKAVHKLSPVPDLLEDLFSLGNICLTYFMLFTMF